MSGAGLLKDDNFLLLLNAGEEAVDFGLQRLPVDLPWRREVDTSLWPEEKEPGRTLLLSRPYPLAPRSLVLLVQHAPGRAQ